VEDTNLAAELKQEKVKVVILNAYLQVKQEE